MENRKDIDFENWNEDSYPTRGEIEEEYFQEWEDEDEEYPHGYAPIQGNWDIDDYEDLDSFERIGKHTKIRSVKTYSEAQTRAKKKQKIKQRSEVKAREAERQKYYHYGQDEED